MPEQKTKSDDILNGLYKSLAPKEPETKGGKGDAKGAPNVHTKAHFEDDLRMVASLGVKGFPSLFGQKVENPDAVALPVNFGSKAQVGALPKDTRLRLFNLKRMIHNVELQAAHMFRGDFITPKMLMSTPLYKHNLQPMLKDFNVTDFADWIETVNARFFFEEYEIPYVLADIFDQLPMDAPTVTVPGDIGHLEGVEETDAAVFSAQSTTQDSYQVISRNNVVHTKITQDFMSDSAPAYMEKLRRDLMMGNARAYERCLLNGDTTGSPRGASHLDADLQALALNATFAKAFDGIRRRAYDNDNTLGGSGNADVAYDHGGDTPSKVLFEKVYNLMGKFTTETSDLRWVVPPSVKNAVVTGAIPELFTAFAFGGLASNVTGQMPPIFGIQAVTSQFAREDLDATAVNSGTPADDVYSAIYLIKPSRFANFVRQAPRMWAAPSLPSSDELLMTSKVRHAWSGNKQTDKELSITMGYHVAK